MAQKYQGHQETPSEFLTGSKNVLHTVFTYTPISLFS